MSENNKTKRKELVKGLIEVLEEESVRGKLRGIGYTRRDKKVSRKARKARIASIKKNRRSAKARRTRFKRRSGSKKRK